LAERSRVLAGVPFTISIRQKKKDFNKSVAAMKSFL
jgi:hypothetical protein